MSFHSVLGSLSRLCLSRKIILRGGGWREQTLETLASSARPARGGSRFRARNQCPGAGERPRTSTSMRGRRGVVDDLAPWGVVPCGCCMMLRRLPRRGGSLDRVSFRSGRSHRRRSLALGRRIASGCGDCRSAKSAADRESHNHLLYCLVHCRVPFVIRASPFSRLHRDRTIRRNFLTKDFEAAL